MTETSDRRALIVVDVQNDFLPGGALAVRGGDAIVDAINALMDDYDIVVATQDWHPANHVSFAATHPGASVGDVIDVAGRPQLLWPTHCVATDSGAGLAEGLDTDRIDAVFRRGTDVMTDGHSGFFDAGQRRDTGLADGLRAHGVVAVTVVGLATDGCVKTTALDALAEGFAVTVVLTACRGVDALANDSVEAVESMRAAGVRVE